MYIPLCVCVCVCACVCICVCICVCVYSYSQFFEECPEGWFRLHSKEVEVYLGITEQLLYQSWGKLKA